MTANPTKPAATWRILVDQGKTFDRTILYKVGGVPFDNTGFEARMQVRRNYNSLVPVLSLSSLAGEIVLGGANGQIGWAVSAVDMEDLIGEYVYDLELYDPTDVDIVIGVVRGSINSRPEVTH
jgi:hypothetical protein